MRNAALGLCSQGARVGGIVVPQLGTHFDFHPSKSCTLLHLRLQKNTRGSLRFLKPPSFQHAKCVITNRELSTFACRGQGGEEREREGGLVTSLQIQPPPIVLVLHSKLLASHLNTMRLIEAKFHICGWCKSGVGVRHMSA